jgi:xanthine/CO dehydrogenase XdhC/CoxF family maturation factor/CTP:molybdopterin cytidylyltransferase MocA
VIAATPTSILAQALAWLRAGHGVVLATLTGFEGSTSRAVGTFMAVADHGAACGSISSGCLEDAIIAEARAVMRKGHGHVTRYGTGSPYIDIRLPCGGGIDLLYTPLHDPDLLEDSLEDLARRRPAHLHLSTQGAARHGASGAGSFPLSLMPDLRLVLFGQGDEFLALARLVRSSVRGSMPFHRWSAIYRPLRRWASPPRIWPAPPGARWFRATHGARSPSCFMSVTGRTPSCPMRWPCPPSITAPWAARTHAGRLERLAAQGVSPDLIARLQGRIGLIPPPAIRPAWPCRSWPRSCKPMPPCRSGCMRRPRHEPSCPDPAGRRARQPFWRGQAGGVVTGAAAGDACGAKPCAYALSRRALRGRGARYAAADITGFEQVLLDPPGAPLSRSLALGVARAAQAGAQAVLIALGDMPLVPAGHLRDLLHHFNGDRIATQVGDHRQPPAIFGARHFPDLIALSGDRGAGALLRDAPALPLGGNAGLDVDTRGDLTRAEHACLSPDPR